MMSPYLPSTVHAIHTTRFGHAPDPSVAEEVVIHRTVRFRVGQSLVSIGAHLMGVERPPVSRVRPAA